MELLFYICYPTEEGAFREEMTRYGEQNIACLNYNRACRGSDVNAWGHQNKTKSHRKRKEKYLHKDENIMYKKE